MKSISQMPRSVAFNAILSLVLPLTCTVHAASVDTAQKEAAIIVTGTRLIRPIGAIAGHVTVIDREEIEQRHDANVLDLLRSVAGIHVTTNGG